MDAPFRDPVSLEAATTLSGGDGRFSIELSDDWRLWGPSGAYLSAITLRAAGEIAQLGLPASYYCTFVRTPEFGPAEISAQMVRHGSRAETIAVELRQQDKVMLSALVRTVAPTEGIAHQHLAPPDVAPPQELEEFRWRGDQRELFTYWNHFERRPASGRWGVDDDSPVQREWLRSIPDASFADPFLDAARSLMALDTFGYIAALRKHHASPFIAPSLDIYAAFHAVEKQTEWLLIDAESAKASGGLIGVDGRVWSEDGVLVASGAAQLLQTS